MGQIPKAKTKGLYDHVLQQLSQAMRQLETIDSHTETEQELEIQGLGLAELGLIQAYLRQDAQWLAGWQAAASAQVLLGQREQQTTHRPPAHLARQVLSCAICSTEVLWPERPGFAVCPACGSDTVRIQQQAEDILRH